MAHRGISLNNAQNIVSTALSVARHKHASPLSMALLDSGGHLKAFASEDGSGIHRGKIAKGKANAALGMGFGTGKFNALVKNNVLPEMFAACINGVTQGQFIPLPGGVLIIEDAQIIGALGISGASSAVDESIAISAIQSCGFIADP